MRMQNRNKQDMYYALQGTVRVPVYDYYEGEDGNKYPIETGENDYPYLEPVLFKGNIATSGGESEAVEFGISVADYSAVLVMDKEALPITETSLIWHETKPVFGDDGYVDDKSADYTVVKRSPSLNSVRYALKRVVK